jgi:CRISPR-associated endoribonuclease Cas6
VGGIGLSEGARMRIWLELGAPEMIRLPLHYNHAVQGLIYRLLPHEYRKTLHDDGYVVDKRSLKLFTFSRIFGRKERIGAGFIAFRPPIKICISSPIESFLSELVDQLVKNPRLQLLGNEIQVTSIEVPRSPVLGEEVVFHTLSPITVYSTLYTAEGKKKTYYYSPYEEEFSQLASINLARKYKAYKGEEIHGDVSITPLGRPKESIVLFKGTVIKAWAGRFKIKGDKRLIEIAYEAGIGSKNSAGFGMVEVVNGA